MGINFVAVPPSGGSLEIGNPLIGTVIQRYVGSSPFGGIPRNWKQAAIAGHKVPRIAVPPSGGSLEIGNHCSGRARLDPHGSPFGGIPRNWKRF